MLPQVSAIKILTCDERSYNTNCVLYSLCCRCKPGYDGKLTSCYQQCPATGGWKDDGLTGCIKPAPYTNGVGTAPLLKPCASGLRE
jgi:hypothetical protein